MLPLLNLILMAAFGGLATVALLASVRHARKAPLWVAKFAFVLVALVVCWLLAPPWAGFVAGTLWMVLVWVPLHCYARSVRAVLLEDYAAARTWASRAPLLHPADGFPEQVELIDIVERLDHGELESGLADLRALHARRPHQEFHSPADDLRFAGDWEGVRAWMEQHLDAEERQAPRHALPYLMALAETGDLRAMAAFHAQVAPAFQRLRNWGFASMAELIVAVASGRRARVETLLAGPLRGLAPDAADVARAAARIADGEVEAGRETLRAMRDRVNFANRLFIDRRLRLDPPDRSVLDDPAFQAALQRVPRRPRLSWFRRTVRLAALLVLLVLASTYWAPWRIEGPPSTLGDPLHYLERVHGTEDPDARLPLVVDLHGWGWVPEFHGHHWQELGVPVRVVLPAGPRAEVYGRSWYPGDDREGWTEELDTSADRLAELLRYLVETRPTVGEPIVTGFSQGGAMAFALATRHPDVVAAAFPVAGALPTAPPRWTGLGPSVPIVAFHGEDDGVIPPDHARRTVGALRDGQWDAELRTYAEVDHDMHPAMRAQLHAEVREVIGSTSR